MGNYFEPILCIPVRPGRPFQPGSAGAALPSRLQRLRLCAGDENHLAAVSAALEQLVSTGGLGQRDALRHDRIELARGQQVEELRQRCAVSGVVLAEIRGQRRLLAVRNEFEQRHHRQGEGNDPQPPLFRPSHAEPHQPPAFAQGAV